MKIIQIIDVRWYNACADFAIKQAQGLALEGHDVLLLANPGSPPELKSREVGLDTIAEIDFSKSIQTFGSARRLSRICRKFNADIVIAHRGESHFITVLAAPRPGVKVVRFRGDVRLPRNDIFSRWLNTKKTDGIAVSTERLKLDYESKFHRNCVPVQVLYPAIETANFAIKESKAALKKKFGLKTDKPVVGIVGRLSPVKGHRYFIEAAKLVSMKHPGTQFVVAGGDAQIKQAELQISAALLKIPDIHFFGILDNIDELISAFDIGVVASIGSEMICRVLLEYYAACLPAVATSINQISELMLLSNGGKLVQPADSVAMSDALGELLGNPEKRSKLASNGKRWVEARSLKQLGSETAEFLEKVAHA